MPSLLAEITANLEENKHSVLGTDKGPKKIHKGIVRNFSYDDFDKLRSSQPNTKDIPEANSNSKKKKIRSSLSNPTDLKLSNNSESDVKTSVEKHAEPVEGRTCGYEIPLRACGCLDICPYRDVGTWPCDSEDCGEEIDLLQHCDAQILNCDGRKSCARDIQKCRKASKKVLARKIDEYCRGVFPLLFGVFNILYWSYYLYA